MNRQKEIFFMIEIRKSNERGNANHGWLKSSHTFSFADYHDPKHMGFRTLCVINEDRIDGGTGFGKHSHRDMEIISYIKNGALKHKDSMGNETVILPGEVQILSAGTGITHSEHNHLASEITHFFQIWITPNKTGLTPSYGQKNFEKELKSKPLVLVVSNDGREGSIKINQNADMYISRFKKGDTLDYKLKSGRAVWIQILEGHLEINGQKVSTGDAVSIQNTLDIKLVAYDKSEIILFDLV